MNARDTYLFGTDILGAPAARSEIEVDDVEDGDLGDQVAHEVESADQAETAATEAAVAAVAVPGEKALSVPALSPAGPTSTLPSLLPVPKRTVPSPIPGISDVKWTQFLLAMVVAPLDSVSASNGYGLFNMKMRRLADLGLVKGETATRGTSKRMIWVGDFVPPMTAERFLSSREAQRSAFGESMRRYVAALADGSIPKPSGGWPAKTTLSGALAILHRCGPQGLSTWADESKRFADTETLVTKANGIF